MSKPAEKTILIVDDEELLRNSIAFDFKRKGFKVLTAESAPSAMAVLKGSAVDLILSDIRMPGGDGISLLEQVRAIHPVNPPLIFLTGYADITQEECIAKGALRVIAKPFDRVVLQRAVFEALGLEMPSLKPAQ